MKTATIYLFLATMLLGLAGCKGPNGDNGLPGPAGPSGPTGPTSIILENKKKSGYIKGNLTGQGLKNTFNVNLNLQGGDASSGRYETYQDSLIITIIKSYAGDGDSLLDGSINLGFTIKSLKNLNSGYAFVDLTFTKMENNNRTISSYGNTILKTKLQNVVTELKYDSTNQILSGNMDISFPRYEGRFGKEVGTSHFIGSFSTKIVELINYRRNIDF